MTGCIYIVGLGPGHESHITGRAIEAIAESNIIVGFKTYVDLIKELLAGKTVVSSPMSEEVTRAQEAIELALGGQKVAVISSGDAGVYGMAGLVYEVLAEKDIKDVQVEIIPGISAINSCASLLGAPVMHDACTISLSDHLTPWEAIAKRLHAAGEADFIIALYNPKSTKRTAQIEEAQKILLQYRPGNTPVGIVKGAYRENQKVEITSLADMLTCEIGMLSTVIIGNTTTFVWNEKMVTPRGYQRKYELHSQVQPLKPHERLRKENEPWALHGGRS